MLELDQDFHKTSDTQVKDSQEVRIFMGTQCHGQVFNKLDYMKKFGSDLDAELFFENGTH